MSELPDTSCFIQTALGANRNKIGEPTEAEDILQSQFDAAEHPLGSVALTEITCERCETTFIITKHQLKNRARGSVYFGSAGLDGQECDEPSLARLGTPSAWVLNLSLRNLKA